MSDLLPVEQALQQILAQAQAISDFETVAISEALGRITFEDCLSTIDVPPADNSAMDGYAINVADCLANDSRLPLSQTINAGHTPLALEKNTCARIFTGADIPTGADSVIMQEHCTHEGEWVQFPSSLKANNNIRQQAQDIAQGQTVVTKGTALKPQHIGLLASIGLAEVKVFRRLTVAILSTGDELVEPGQPLSASKIYNSNRPMLAAFLQQMSCNVLDLRTVEDTLEATIALLKQAGEADCIISTGGVSVGNEDHIKPAVEALGELNLWRIAMKPGKPLAFAQLTTIAEKPIPFFGLPGNPVSTFTTFLLFAQPFLRKLSGHHSSALRTTTYRVNFSHKLNPKRQEYLRVKIENGSAIAYPNQSSGVLSSTVWADGLAIIPPNTQLKKDDWVSVISL